jgi:hypothetical protein
MATNSHIQAQNSRIDNKKVRKAARWGRQIHTARVSRAPRKSHIFECIEGEAAPFSSNTGTSSIPTGIQTILNERRACWGYRGCHMCI